MITGRRIVAVGLAFLGIVSMGLAGEGGARETVPLTAWEFAPDMAPNGATLSPPTQAQWSPVTIPHIFRQSGLPDNAAGWYRQTVVTTEADRGRRMFLVLEGAASVKDVFVNGRPVGQHKSAYTAATFDLTPALEIGTPNRLDVRVSNRDDETQGMIARSILYYVNGGMYRKAWLVKTGAVHIFPDMGSSGVYLTPAHITPARADLGVRTVVRNPLGVAVDVVARHRVTDLVGKEVADFSARAAVPAGETVSVVATGAIADPKLWDLGQPNLYTVRTELLVNGKVSDVVTERTGIRTIAYTGKGFLLNGREIQFRGVNKHAQDEYVWNAMPDGNLLEEWKWMADMGVNAVRLAHYPHSHFEYESADEYGIAVWAENGFAGQMWAKAIPAPLPSDGVVTPDAERQTREMVRQNWNHPSILFWSCGNETLTGVAGHYAHVIREEQDPGRLITYAYAMTNICPTNCDFTASNIYHGWYQGSYDEFRKANALIAETGGGSWPSHHVPYGTIQWSVDSFEPEEYMEMFTEFRLQTICRDDVANRPMFFWWTFLEFYNNKFKNNRNAKGLVTLGGMRKDNYFLFQAFLRPGTPMVHINGRHHFLRRFAADNGIKAYANVPALELTVNGVSQGWMKNGGYRIPDSIMKNGGNRVPDAIMKTEKTGEKFIPGIPVDNVFFWKSKLAPGRNVIEVSDGAGHRDRMVVYQRPADGPMPADPKALVQDLASSNPASPALFVDRPVEAQSPFYTDVDGSSDNTFDVLPAAVNGASWIGTRRLGDKKCKTDLSFRINPGSAGATVFVMFSTGTFPVVTLKKSDQHIAKTAATFTKALSAAGFADSGEKAVWRDHNLERADAALWSRVVKAGETVTIPGHTLDYVILVKAKTGEQER